MTDFERIVKELTGVVGKENIKTDPGIIDEHAVDGVKPKAVIYPADAEQIAEVVKFANREDLAVLPRGSGSKIAMGNPPKRLDLIVCTSRLDRISDVDTANLTITVQAGVKFKDVQLMLASRDNRCYLPLETPATEADDPICSDRENSGCFLPLDPPFSKSTTMGGLVAGNSSGPRRLLYGLARDMILGVRFVAPDGEIIGAGGKTVKNVSGYDISKLMIGSCGSLGILCEMTLRLLPLPGRMGTSLSHFSRLEGASGFIDRIFETSLLPAAVELLNHRAYSFLAPEGLPGFGDNGFVVAVGLEGVEEAVERMSSEIGEMASASGAEKALYLEDDQHQIFWDSYSNLVSKISGRFPGMVSVRLNYPISRYTEVCKLVQSLAQDNHVEHALLSHAGNGIATIHLLNDTDDAGGADGIVSVVEKFLEHCRGIEGNLVVERAGPGMKPKLPVWGAPRDDMIVMKLIKQEIDPLGIFCPGRFIGGI